MRRGGWYGSAKTDNGDRINHELCKSASPGEALGKLRASGLFNVIVLGHADLGNFRFVCLDAIAFLANSLLPVTALLLCMQQNPVSLPLRALSREIIAVLLNNKLIFLERLKTAF